MSALGGKFKLQQQLRESAIIYSQYYSHIEHIYGVKKQNCTIKLNLCKKMHTKTCNVHFSFYICTNKNEMCNKKHIRC